MGQPSGKVPVGYCTGLLQRTLRPMHERVDQARRTELMSRECNGLTVRLLWSRQTKVVTVAVIDAASGDNLQARSR
jgi:hypothetical protein